MKKLNFLCLLGLLVIGLGFVSCSDNDGDDKVGDVSLLIGLWEPVYSEGYEMIDGEKKTWSKEVTDNDYVRVEFFGDGTVKSYEYQGNSWILSSLVNYQVKGNSMIFFDENGTIIDGESIIHTLTSTQFVLSTKNVDGNWEYYEKVTYRKIDSGSDDEGGEITGGDDNVNANLLLGLWDPIYCEGYEAIDGEKKSWSEEVTNNDYARVEFFGDGTVKSYEYQGNSWELSVLANYQLKGNELILFDENGDIVEDENTIHSLTSTQLVMSTKVVDGNWEYYEIITYRKME